MLILSVSDLHLGKGSFLVNGQPNILEDFHEDERFSEFLEFYSTGTNYLSDVHLVLNGDILNLIQVDVDGVFNHILDEEITTRQVETIYKGHKAFFKALKAFVARPNKKVTYIIGNHDSGMAYEKAQSKFCEYVGAKIEFSFTTTIANVYIEHGHRFEAVNCVDDDKYFIKGPLGEKILNLPWGSLFCISLLPMLKKERPFIDKVRPLAAYVKWCIFHDPAYFFKILYVILKYILGSSISEYTKNNTSFMRTFKIISEITIYPKYVKHAKNLLEVEGRKAVVMGHSHVVEWRKFAGNKYYLNTGTWNPIPSMNPALYDSIKKLSYVYIDVNVKTNSFREVSIKEWKGKWRPYRDEISIPV